MDRLSSSNVEMSIVNTPNEVLGLILRDDSTSLESIVALSQTCPLLRNVLEGLDGTIVKQKVLDRIPWMEIGQPGTHLDTWMTAARRIVGRKRSFVSENHKWIDSTEYYDMLGRISHNTDINYIESIEIDGKMQPQGRNLPTDFNPLFVTEMPTPCGGLTGKFMEEIEGDGTRFIDLTTLVYSRAHPHPPPTASTWTGNLSASFNMANGERAARTPMSGICTINKSGHRYNLLQETGRWILVEIQDDYEDPDAQEIRFRNTKYLLDKKNIVLEDGETRLYFDTDSGDNARVYPDAQLTFVHLLPGSIGAIVFQDNGEMVLVYYDDIVGDKGRVLLTFLDFQGQEFAERLRSTQYGQEGLRERGTRRQLVVTYGGMLYLHIRESFLVPLWVELDDKACHPHDDRFSEFEAFAHTSSKVVIGGLRADMKTLLLAPEREMLSLQQTYGIIRSENGRWAMQTLSCGRIVADLATQKTFIIRPQAKWPNPGFVFVGLDVLKQRPVFYRCHMAYGIKQDADGWEDLDESYGRISNIKDTGSYLKFRDPNEIAANNHFRMIPHRYTVVQPNIRDQSEMSVPLVI